MDWFMSQTSVVQALLSTLFTYGVTAAGAALVFFFRDIRRKPLDIMMGFAAGVMIAASFWSLLSPAIELSSSLGHNAWLTAAVGFVSGGVFIMLTDIWLSRTQHAGRSTNKSSLMLVSAITMHNVPEGLAVGVAFGCAQAGVEGASVLSALLLAVGIGLQNFPEGLCAAVPMRKAGKSCSKSFLIGQSSGAVEPIAGVLGAVAAAKMQALLPFALTTSYAGTHCYHQKLFHATTAAVYKLAVCSSIGIVAKHNRHTQTCFQHLFNLEVTTKTKVRSIIDTAGIIVSVRSTDTNTFYLRYIVLSQQRLYFVSHSVHIQINVAIFGSRKISTSHYNTILVYQSYIGLGTSHINAYRIFFVHIFYRIILNKYLFFNRFLDEIISHTIIL